MAGRRPQKPAAVAVLGIDSVADVPTQRAFDQTQDAVVNLQDQMRRRLAELDTLNAAAVSAPSSQWVSVLTFDAVGNGFADDTVALQTAIDATQGRTLYIPRGTYRFSSTLFIRDNSHHIVGDFGNRAIDGGTELVFTGTGPAIQIGVDNGNDWNAGNYDGQQDQLFENFHLSHGAPDTALVSAGDATLRFKTGAYGIWDWRGGGIVTRDLGIEKFEANFVAIESDFDDLEFRVSLYSKYGIYIGPRSDQCTIKLRNSFFCDRCITVDGARQVRINDSSFVGAGTPTSSSIEIRQGSGGVWIEEAWFEHLQGYAGTDQQSFVSIGEVAGYGSGGSIQSPGGSPSTLPVEGAAIDHPLLYTTIAGQPNHTKYIASIGKCRRFVLGNPTVPPNISLANFDALVGVQAAQAPSITDTQIRIEGVSSDSSAVSFVNLGAGSPAVAIWATGPSGTVFTDRVSLTKDIKFTNELVAPNIGGNTNDYNVAGFATAAVVLLTSSGAFNVTGIAVGFAPAVFGRWVRLYNVGANNITLTHQDALSTDINRMICPGGVGFVMTPGLHVDLYYSPSLSRWLV